jgi:uncharacterized protein
MIPLPKPDPHTRPFWDGCLDGVLRYQRCQACSKVQFTPRASCERCHGDNLVWHDATSLGTVLTFTRVHRAALPEFRDKVPYDIAILEMDEGFRLMVNASQALSSQMAIGLRVKVGFVMQGEVALPIAEESL